MTGQARVLITYYSATGKTERMARYIAEGVRFSGNEPAIKKTGELKDAADLEGYDGYIIGSPTYSLDLPKPVDAFLLTVEKAGLEGKMAAAFGPYLHDASYRHDSHAASIICDRLQRVSRMKLFELGPLTLKEEVVETREGMKACQDYGRVFGEKLAGLLRL